VELESESTLRYWRYFVRFVVRLCPESLWFNRNKTYSSLRHMETEGFSVVEIKDLAGLSEPLKKLIEVIAEGIGGVSRPILIRKNADAKAYEIRTMAQAIEDSQKLLGPISYCDGLVAVESASPERFRELPDTTMDKRVMARLSYQEAKRQSNVESITQHAFDELDAEPSAAEEKVDADWISRFFRIAEDITTALMQSLWGKILAGEVKRPGSYSLRTLDSLKNITQTDAELFVRFSRYAICSGGKVFVINPDNGKYLEESLHFTFSDYLRLRELGLLVPIDLEFSLAATDEPVQKVFTCGSTCILIDRPKDTPKQELTAIVYAEVGVQLLQLVDKEPADFNYLKKSASFRVKDEVEDVSTKGTENRSRRLSVDILATDNSGMILI